MKKIKRMAGGALALALAAGMFAGCGGTASGSSSAAAGASSAASDAAEQENMTVSVFRCKMPFEVSMDQMEIFDVMADKFNFTFEFDNPSYENYIERLNLVMMQEELPDVIMGMSATDMFEYAQAGVIVPLTDYIQDGKMPNYKKWLDSHEGLEKSTTSADGEIYYLTAFKETYSGNTPYIVRTDWLDQLGMDRPVTIEDWENYWAAVKTTDLNGNGKNDEQPFSDYGLEHLRNFCTAWGVVDDFYSDPTDGGKVHYGPIEDRYKEAVTWMNEMWNKGYIDPEIITLDESSFNAKIAQNTVASFRGTLGGMMATPNSTMTESVPDFHLAATEPPLGEAGVQVHTNIDSMGGDTTMAVITTACEDVDRVVEWFDYMYSDEGIILMNMGIEGETYTMVDGEPVYTDYVMNNPDGLSAKYAVGTFTIMQGFGPSVMSDANINSVDDASVVEAKENYINPFLEESSKYILPGTLGFTSEQNEIKTTKMADIETYVDEMIMNFITGRESLDNWDTYVSKVKEMGIDDVIGVYQDAMDAWSS